MAVLASRLAGCPPMHECAEMILQHCARQYAEVEFRIGRQNRDMFDTNVREDVFRKVQRRLERYTEWEKKIHCEDEVYTWDNGIRCVYNDACDTSVCIKKEKVLVHDMKHSPLDVRLGISLEVPKKQPSTESNGRRVRKRVSYIRKNVSIDLTEVHGNPGDIDDENSVVYRIELEIVDPSRVKTVFDAYTIIWKISDVLKICV